MLTLFPRIRPNPLPPPSPPPEPPAASKTAQQTLDQPAVADEPESLVAGVTEVVACDLPTSAEAVPTETSSAGLPVDSLTASEPTVADDDPASPAVTLDSHEEPLAPRDTRPAGLPFAAANIFDEIEILHETSVELRTAFVVEIPRLTLEEVVRATNDANRRPEPETYVDATPTDVPAAQVATAESGVADHVTVTAQGSAATETAETSALHEMAATIEAADAIAPEEIAGPVIEGKAAADAAVAQVEAETQIPTAPSAETVEFSDQEVADIVAPQFEPLAVPFDPWNEKLIAGATGEEILAQTSSAQSPAPQTNANEAVAEAPVSPEVMTEAAEATIVGTPEHLAATEPAEVVTEVDIQPETQENALVADEPATALLAEVIAPMAEAAVVDVPAAIDAAPVPPIEAAIETSAEPSPATELPATQPVRDVTPIPVHLAATETDGSVAEIRAHLATIETGSLPAPALAKTKRPKGIGFFESVRVPEEEAMDDAGEVEAYASAAAQAHLDAVDDTFVAHAQLLIKGRERGRALDIGTGPGQIVLKLGSQLTRWKFVGVDRSAAMIEKARESLASTPEVAGRVEFRIADGSALDLPDATFDMVVCNSVLHHMAEPQKLFSEMARVVKPGGAILLRDLRRPARFEFSGHIRKHGKHYDGEMKRLYVASLHAAYTEEELQKMLAVSALRGVRIFRHGKTHIGFERAISTSRR